MILQLDSTVAKSGDPNPVGSAGGVSRGAGRDASGSGTQDSIRISGASSALNRLATDRAAHIQQLTAAVQSGSYSVSGDLVAGAMVANALPSES
jgi:anti-sigma28 factor (negative regulator of flagellin synthesis)